MLARDPPLWSTSVLNPIEGDEMITETRSYKGYELTATQNCPKWDVGRYPSGPHLRWPSPNFQIFFDADIERAFEKVECAVDELLGVALPLA
jgi:hypothetical protein